MARFCSQCGVQIPDGAAYCPQCGTPVREANQTVAAAYKAQVMAKPQSTGKSSAVSLIVLAVGGVVLALFGIGVIRSCIKPRSPQGVPVISGKADTENEAQNSADEGFAESKDNQQQTGEEFDYSKIVAKEVEHIETQYGDYFVWEVTNTSKTMCDTAYMEVKMNRYDAIKSNYGDGGREYSSKAISETPSIVGYGCVGSINQRIKHDCKYLSSDYYDEESDILFAPWGDGAYDQRSHGGSATLLNLKPGESRRLYGYCFNSVLTDLTSEDKAYMQYKYECESIVFTDYTYNKENYYIDLPEAWNASTSIDEIEMPPAIDANMEEEGYKPLQSVIGYSVDITNNTEKRIESVHVYLHIEDESGNIVIFENGTPFFSDAKGDRNVLRSILLHNTGAATWTTDDEGRRIVGYSFYDRSLGTEHLSVSEFDTVQHGLGAITLVVDNAYIDLGETRQFRLYTMPIYKYVGESNYVYPDCEKGIEVPIDYKALGYKLVVDGIGYIVDRNPQ